MNKIAASAFVALALSGEASAVCGNIENVAVPETTPTSDFMLYADGTATHTRTGLMWMRCAVGKTWNGSACIGNYTLVNWSQALVTAHDFTFAGYDDWRLPNVKELMSIIEERCAVPPYNADVFPGNEQTMFWSSTPHANALADSSDSALRLLDGQVWYELKLMYLPIRLVRDTPTSAALSNTQVTSLPATAIGKTQSATSLQLQTPMQMADSK